MKKNFLCMAAMLGFSALHADMARAQDSEVATYRIAAIKWEYKPMAKAQAYFEEQRARYAPDSSLRFRVPKQVRGASEKQVLKLLGPDTSDEIALDESKSFALPRLTDGNESDTTVVADGYFKKGSYALPVPVVRTAGLAPNMLRVGDVRLTCRTQVAYVRAYKMAFNLLIGSLKAFSLEVCAGKDRDFGANAPIAYNKATWMVGDQIIKVETLPSVRRELRVPVGDETIVDDTLIAFELVPSAASGEQDSKAQE